MLRTFVLIVLASVSIAARADDVPAAPPPVAVAPGSDFMFCLKAAHHVITTTTDDSGLTTVKCTLGDAN